MSRSNKRRRGGASRPTRRPRSIDLRTQVERLHREYGFAPYSFESAINAFDWDAPITDNEWNDVDVLKEIPKPRHLTLIQPNTNKPQAPYRGPRLYSNLVKTAAVSAVAATAPKTVCEQRQTRREVMFATNKAGKVGQKKPRFTLNSKIRCK